MSHADNTSGTALPAFARDRINLASARLGAAGVFASDAFFAPLERMLSDEPAVFIADKYDDHGKWMDGWESRRKRTPGHDFAIVRLAAPGMIDGFDVDTSHFTGNYPPHCSIEAAKVDAGDPHDATEWTEILEKSPLEPDRHHFLAVTNPAAAGQVWTHLRVHIFPDGGLARLRVYGTAHFDWSRVGKDEEVDLVDTFHGGRALFWSDAHYGHPDRMLGPGRGVNMGDGWETARRRGPGHDWAIFRLGHAGAIRRVVVDTAHFKGNYPERFDLLGVNLAADAAMDEEAIEASQDWAPIVSGEKLEMDHIHEFAGETVADVGPVTHVCLNIHPDGGVSRLRLFGTVR